MFRKNFREGGPSGAKASGGGGLKNKNAIRYQAKRTREMSLNSDAGAFRTHIFFTAANRSGVGYQNTMEGYTSLHYFFLFKTKKKNKFFLFF